MLLSLLLLGNLLLSIGCASSVEIPDFKAYITLPASGDGYWVKTASDNEGRVPKDQWSVTSRRGIIVLSEDWAILRYTILKNCLTMKCNQVVGTFDGLFNSLDDALSKLPIKK